MSGEPLKHIPEEEHDAADDDYEFGDNSDDEALYADSIDACDDMPGLEEVEGPGDAPGDGAGDVQFSVLFHRKYDDDDDILTDFSLYYSAYFQK